jgi:hypothetical protein
VLLADLRLAETFDDSLASKRFLVEH